MSDKKVIEYAFEAAAKVHDCKPAQLLQRENSKFATARFTLIYLLSKQGIDERRICKIVYGRPASRNVQRAIADAPKKRAATIAMKKLQEADESL